MIAVGDIYQDHVTLSKAIHSDCECFGIRTFRVEKVKDGKIKVRFIKSEIRWCDGTPDQVEEYDPNVNNGVGRKLHKATLVDEDKIQVEWTKKQLRIAMKPCW